MSRMKLWQLMTFLVSAIVILVLVGSYKEEGAPTETKASVKPIDDPDISIFSQAIKAAGLQDLFEGTGPFTAFVPSNSAFEKLGKEKWNTLLKPENKDQLTSILTYHIVPGKHMSQYMQSKTLRTINGKNIDIKVDGGVIRVNNAKVVRVDMVGPNGVIHEIDTVLIP